MPKGRSWQKADDEYLMANTILSRQELADKLNRTPAAVSKRIHDLRHAGSKEKKSNRWKEEDLQYIQDNGGTMTYQEMAKALGRTYNATRHQGLLLNKHKVRPRENSIGAISDEQKEKLCRFMDALHTYAEIAQEAGRKPDAGKFMNIWHRTGGI